MGINISLLNEIYRGFHIQRWNERIRPMELIEIDKHAHKMIIAYVLGKYEEDKGNKIDWNQLIREGIFEMLRRIVISDIRSPIYYEIKKHKEVFHSLNEFIFEKLEPKFANEDIKKEIKKFLFTTNESNNLTSRVSNAAHVYASYWEFQIIKHSNPFGYENTKIQTEMLNRLNQYRDIEGLTKLINQHTISNFIDKCGQLRFQYRWAQVPRLTKTSVLGHSMFVAVISYLFAREQYSCDKRIYNSFFGGLFHDLPEIVTRDIISPVKRSSSELDNLIKKLEYELTSKEVLPLLDKTWHKEILYYITDEFDNKIIDEKGQCKCKISTDEINQKYNQDRYNPYDGELIRAADHLSAFLEAWYSIEQGIKNTELHNAADGIKKFYTKKKKKIGNIELNVIYDNFK